MRTLIFITLACTILQLIVCMVTGKMSYAAGMMGWVCAGSFQITILLITKR